MSEKIYRVQMNSKGMPNFATAEEVADRPQMSDLINGREMLKRYQVDLCYGIACKECSMCTEDGGCRIEEWIDKFPSADRPQGEWELVGERIQYRRCPYCKRPRAFQDTRFCDWCGARMKGADDE